MLLISFLVPEGFEVNFMDDVGQTLLNWASAFGTQEMVSQNCACQYLCALVSYLHELKPFMPHVSLLEQNNFFLFSHSSSVKVTCTNFMQKFKNFNLRHKRVMEICSSMLSIGFITVDMSFRAKRFTLLKKTSSFLENICVQLKTCPIKSKAAEKNMNQCERLQLAQGTISCRNYKLLKRERSFDLIFRSQWLKFSADVIKLGI